MGTVDPAWDYIYTRTHTDTHIYSYLYVCVGGGRGIFHIKILNSSPGLNSFFTLSVCYEFTCRTKYVNKKKTFLLLSFRCMTTVHINALSIMMSLISAVNVGVAFSPAGMRGC